jgi:PadR family transcriptional regulator AphA
MSTNSRENLTPTSFAMLSLLSIQPWTTYELAKQMQRSVQYFWPRAERKLYDEPKRLVALGLASSRSVATGKRMSNVYEITADGRAALRDWLRDGPGEPIVIEMEPLLRVFFADGASTADLHTTLAGIESQASDTLGRLGAMAAEIAAGIDHFAGRRATNALAMELLVRLHETERDWAAWAQAEVDTWPPVHRGRQQVAAGSPERGSELFAAIVDRLSAPDGGVHAAD